LVVVGLVWAIASESMAGNQSFTFNDANDPVKGPENATVVVRVFSDFQCPACRVAEAGLQYAIKTYGDRVRFVWNDFPLQAIHANALPAANAARCAEAQGKFWEYQGRLYDDQTNWESLQDPSEKFAAYAQALDLDVEAFSACYKDKAFQDYVMKDLQEGEGLGIEGTPAFFIGEKKVMGALTNEQWDTEIKAQLGGK
jgi:protein-disulfide isomerase